MEARRIKLIAFVLQATETQLSQLENVAYPSSGASSSSSSSSSSLDLYSKVKDGDAEATQFLTSLPVSVVVNLFKFLSVKDALKLCSLNKAFGRWCEENGFVQELRRNKGIREEDAVREYAQKLAWKFTGTNNIMMEFTRGDDSNNTMMEEDFARGDDYIRLDDRNGEGGMIVDGGYVTEALSLLPVPKTEATFRGGFGPGEMKRFSWPDQIPENAEIVNTYPRSSRSPNQLRMVTRDQLSYYETFFYNLIKAGWTLSTILNTTEGGYANPVVETIDTKVCSTCKTKIGSMYACSACNTRHCQSCGKKHLQRNH